MMKLRGLQPTSLLGTITGALLGTLVTGGTTTLFIIACVFGLFARLLLDVMLERWVG